MEEDRLYDVYAIEEDINILKEFIKNNREEDPFNIYFEKRK